MSSDDVIDVEYVELDEHDRPIVQHVPVRVTIAAPGIPMPPDAPAPRE